MISFDDEIDGVPMTEDGMIIDEISLLIKIKFRSL
jgi:hypothetical protein